MKTFVTNKPAPRAGWLSLVSLVSATLAAGMHQIARAAEAAPFAAPVAPGAISPAGGTLRVTVAMILVLAAVLGAGWLMRRMRAITGVPAGALEVLAQVSLGTRERAILVRVGEQQLLIGVAPGNVRTLHVVAASSMPIAEAGAGPQPSEGTLRPSFKSLLLKSLGK